jgi:putative PIN family toxin of toxin-antitoxin system
MALLRVVLDTNIVVSAHLKPDGLERRVLRLALAHQLQLYLSSEIFEEYGIVLNREKFGIDSEKVAESLRNIREAAILTHPKRALSVSPDPDDNKFLECADAAEADYFVTGNKRHFPKTFGKTKIVNANELIQIIASEFQR